jgi:DNA repair protein RadC
MAQSREVIEPRQSKAEVVVDSPEDVFLLLAAKASGLDHAHLWRVDLDLGNGVLGYELIASGGHDARMVHPLLIFRGAQAAGAAKIVLVHNHVSQMPAASDEDQAITDIMAAFGDSRGIPVYDHVIVTKTAYFSFKEAGRIAAQG